MSGIDVRIMAFVGTEESSELVSRLAEFTDGIYAAVSEKYGRSSFPGGNITIISSYLDEAGIQRWIDRTGVGIIIDGTAEDREHESAVIEKKAEENGIEYLRIKTDLQISRNARICRGRSEILSGLEYTSGNILVEGSELYSFLTASGVDPERLIAAAAPVSSEIKKLEDAGCRPDHMICLGMDVDGDFMLAVLDELKIHNYVMKGGKNRGIAAKMDAMSHSDARAFIDGELAEENGSTAEEVWKKLSERFGLRD